MIGAMLALALGAPAQQPVTAEASGAGNAVHVRVVGTADRPVHVRYALTSGGNGNRATQSGSAVLAPAQRIILLDLTQTAGSDWTGRLDVILDDRARYSLAIRP